MVKILVDHVEAACSALEKNARRRQNEIEAVEDVMKSLGNLSGMERVTGELRVEVEKLKQEQKGLLDMLQGLIRIREIYLRTDKRICDCAEGDIVRFHYPETTYINIPVFEKGIIINKKVNKGEEYE